MKIKNPRQINKKILIIVLIVSVLIVSFFAMYVFAIRNVTPSSPRPEATPTVNLDTEKKADTNLDTKPENMDIKPSSIPPNNATLSSSITSVSVMEGTLRVRAVINEVLNTGECSFAATKGNEKITKTVAIQSLPSSATCKGFDISTDELSEGEWKFTLTISTGNRSNQLNGSFKV